MIPGDKLCGVRRKEMVRNGSSDLLEHIKVQNLVDTCIKPRLQYAMWGGQHLALGEGDANIRETSP